MQKKEATNVNTFKYMQELYGQNCKTVLRDIKEYLKKLRNIPDHGWEYPIQKRY